MTSGGKYCKETSRSSCEVEFKWITYFFENVLKVLCQCKLECHKNRKAWCLMDAVTWHILTFGHLWWGGMYFLNWS